MSTSTAVEAPALPRDVAPIGVQLRRSKGWRMPPHTRSVARPGSFGNVYVPGPGMTAEECVQAYRQDTEFALEHYPHIKVELRKLTGWNLACWCPLDAPCHRNVLLELANGPLVCEAA